MGWAAHHRRDALHSSHASFVHRWRENNIDLTNQKSYLSVKNTHFPSNRRVMSDVETVLAAYPRISFACRPRHVRDPDSGEAISAHQASVLSHLDEHDPTMVGELAEHLGVTASTMSLTLKRLERDGYVRRDRDPADRRVMNVRLTAAGARVRDAHTVLDPALVVRMLAGMDAERRRDAVHGLRLLAEAADALVRSRRRDVEARIGEEGA